MKLKYAKILQTPIFACFAQLLPAKNSERGQESTKITTAIDIIACVLLLYHWVVIICAY